MTAPVGVSRAQDSAGLGRLARRVVVRLGGRYSAALGIDVAVGDAEIERWSLAATLFGTRITAQIAERTFGVLAGAGVSRIGQARHIPQGAFIAYLDEGGYARYDARMVARIGQRVTTYPALRAALDVLPGWGPATIQLFLRELRGVWPGAQPPLDPRAEYAARHLGLPGPGLDPDVPRLAQLAAAPHTDPRDLESGLVTLTLAHPDRGMSPLPRRGPLRPADLTITSVTEHTGWEAGWAFGSCQDPLTQCSQGQSRSHWTLSRWRASWTGSRTASCAQS